MFLGVVVIYLKTNFAVFPYLLQLIRLLLSFKQAINFSVFGQNLRGFLELPHKILLLEILKIPCVPVCINRVCINLIYISSTQAEHSFCVKILY